MKDSSKLLLDELPLVILPSLAVKVGLNQAIVLQQIHYWLKHYQEKAKTDAKERRRHYHDGRWWVFNTYKGWKDNFPFWSTHTIRRAIDSLREQGLILIGRYNAKAYDKTNWYTIDYDRLSKMDNGATVQNGQMEAAKMDTPIPETTTETTVTATTTTARDFFSDPDKRRAYFALKEAKINTRNLDGYVQEYPAWYLIWHCRAYDEQRDSGENVTAGNLVEAIRAKLPPTHNGNYNASNVTEHLIEHGMPADEAMDLAMWGDETAIREWANDAQESGQFVYDYVVQRLRERRQEMAEKS